MIFRKLKKTSRNIIKTKTYTVDVKQFITTFWFRWCCWGTWTTFRRCLDPARHSPLARKRSLSFDWSILSGPLRLLRLKNLSKLFCKQHAMEIKVQVFCNWTTVSVYVKTDSYCNWKLRHADSLHNSLCSSEQLTCSNKSV